VAHPQDKTDPRAVRTVARLVEALSELCAAGPEVLPSVEEVARRAGVNRSSFYAHFDDLDALVAWWLEQELRPVFERDLTMRSDPARVERDLGRVSIAALVEALAVRRAPLATLFRGSATSRHRFAELFAAWMEPNFAAVGERLGWGPLDGHVAALFYGTGIATVLVAWTVGDVDCDAAELAERCVALVPEALRVS
jgi:AcrR family transcriptional regulator